MRKKLLILLLSALALMIVGCGVDEKDTKGSASQEKQNDSSNSGDVKTIVAATTGLGPKPFVYSDENDEVTGYEIDLLKKIFEQLPQYELEVKTTEFPSIFTGIDSGYYQIGFNQIAYNHERGEKYIFSDPVTDPRYSIIAREDDDTIKSIEDIGGHKTLAASTDAYVTLLNNYNDANPDNQIEIEYTDDKSAFYLGIVQGINDFYIGTRIQLNEQISDLGIKGLKIIDIPDEEYEKYKGTVIGQGFVFSKNDEELANEVNKVLEQFVEDGTIEELTEKWLKIENATPITKDKIKQFKDFIASDLE